MDNKVITREEKIQALDLLFETLGLQIRAKDLIGLQTLVHADNEQRKIFKGFSFRQKLFIKAYTQNYGNITVSAQKANIHRVTYFGWRKNTKGFADYIDSLEMHEVANDINELAIMKLIEAGNPYVTIARAKMKMRHRGYLGESKGPIEAPQQNNVHWYLPDNQRDKIPPNIQDVNHQDVTEQKTNHDNSPEAK